MADTQHDAKIEVTNAMVDAAVYHIGGGDDERIEVRRALTAALALVTPDARFRAGAEWAAKRCDSRAEYGRECEREGSISSPNWMVIEAESLAHDIRFALAALPEGRDGWLDISSAPKDGSTIWAALRSDLSEVLKLPYDIWDGQQVPLRHPGLTDDIGWNIAAPVGHGGFPDEWIAGWRPLPVSDAARTIEEMALQIVSDIDLGDERQVETTLACIGFWPADIDAHMHAAIDRARALRAHAEEMIPS